MNHSKPIALVLAAGNSGRMGKTKIFLPFDNKHTFLEQIIYVFSSFGCEEIRIVLNAEGMNHIDNKFFLPNVHFILNKHPEKERFYSIQTGLNNVAKNKPVFLHNGDNPMVHKEVLKQLWNAYNGQSVIIPEFHTKGGHPILLPSYIIQKIVQESNIKTNLKKFLEEFPQNRIPVDDQGVLTNINTPEDYNKYFTSI